MAKKHDMDDLAIREYSFDEDDLDGERAGLDDDDSMPEEVKKIMEDRIKETESEKHKTFDPSDMYLDDFKKNFG